MKNSIDILDAVAAKLGGVSDYRIWKDVGIYHGTISSVRAGRCSLSAANLAKAADVLGVEVGALIAIVAAEREEDQEIRDSLLRVAERGMKIAAQAGRASRRKVAAAALLAVGLQVVPTPPAQAAVQQPAACLLCKVSSRRQARPARRRSFGYPKRAKRIVYRGLHEKIAAKLPLVLQKLSDTRADILRAA